jgi:hypothetical protein
MRMVTALFTILRKLATGRVRPIGGLSQCARALAPSIARQELFTEAKEQKDFYRRQRRKQRF